jgi:hypothetical protein
LPAAAAISAKQSGRTFAIRERIAAIHPIRLHLLQKSIGAAIFSTGVIASRIVSRVPGQPANPIAIA